MELVLDLEFNNLLHLMVEDELNILLDNLQFLSAGSLNRSLNDGERCV
jgi:hypothetical protein